MSWHAQKQSVLRGEANYDYYTPEYYAVPTDVFYRGFNVDDGSRSNAYGSNAAAPAVLPRTPQGMYLPHQGELGWASMSDEFIRMDYAPIQRKAKNMQLGILQSMHNVQPVAHNMVGNTAQVTYSDAVLRDPGNAIGTVIGPPRDGSDNKHGRLQGYTLPTNFFASQ